MCNRCVSLKYISIPNKVLSIGSQAFYNCVSLKNIFFSESLKFIAPFAFYGCSLTNVEFENNENWQCCGIYTWDNYNEIKPNDVEYTKDYLNAGFSFKNQ